MNLANFRTDYRRGRLRREHLNPDPITQFNFWLNEACDADVVEPTAMSLATAWKDGRPLVRTVFLKGLDGRDFVFFTNLESRKARQLHENPNVALLFPWLALERQGSHNRLCTETLRVGSVRVLRLLLFCDPDSEA